MLYPFVSLARSHLIDSPSIYNADYGYGSWEAYSNLSYFTRVLPPVAKDCPTPMGVSGEYFLPLENQFSQIPEYRARPAWSHYMTGMIYF